MLRCETHWGRLFACRSRAERLYWRPTSWKGNVTNSRMVLTWLPCVYLARSELWIGVYQVCNAFELCSQRYRLWMAENGESGKFGSVSAITLRPVHPRSPSSLLPFIASSSLPVTYRDHFLAQPIKQQCRTCGAPLLRRDHDDGTPHGREQAESSELFPPHSQHSHPRFSKSLKNRPEFERQMTPQVLSM